MNDKSFLRTYLIQLGECSKRRNICKSNQWVNENRSCVGELRIIRGLKGSKTRKIMSNQREVNHQKRKKEKEKKKRKTYHCEMRSMTRSSAPPRAVSTSKVAMAIQKSREGSNNLRLEWRMSSSPEAKLEANRLKIPGEIWLWRNASDLINSDRMLWSLNNSLQSCKIQPMAAATKEMWSWDCMEMMLHRCSLINSHA